ncbi:MAG TPA: hypothetical protein VFF09_02855 [archaeon]|nr:hypothetical protein [archaeon]
MYSEMVYKKLENIEKEVKSLRKNLKTDKKASLKGILNGLKFKERDFKEAEKSLFRA